MLPTICIYDDVRVEYQQELYYSCSSGCPKKKLLPRHVSGDEILSTQQRAPPHTLLELQTHFGGKPLQLQVVCPQNGTAAPKRIKAVLGRRHPDKIAWRDWGIVLTTWQGLRRRVPPTGGNIALGCTPPTAALLEDPCHISQGIGLGLQSA